MGYVYQIRNTVKPGVYIGSTYDIQNRWRQHRYDLSRGTHHSLYLQRSWNKYGESAFVFEILETPPDVETREREQWWLDHQFQETAVVANYNMAPLAHGGRPSEVWTLEQKAHMSRVKTGQKCTENSRQKMRDSHAAKNAVFTLVSPDGEEFRVQNIRDFARKHDLICTALGLVTRKRLKQHKGWTLKNSPYAPKTFAFASPEGIVFNNIVRCDVFCQEHNLCRKQMSAVHTGKIKSHRGWTKHVDNNSVV